MSLGCLILASLSASGVEAAPSETWLRGATYCPIQDLRVDPVFMVGLEYTLPAKAATGKDLALLGVDTTADLLYFRDVLLADLDLRLTWNSVSPVSDGDLRLPDALTAFAVDTRWTWRYVNDSALQWRLNPGVYAALDAWTADALSIPFSVTGIKTVAPSVSAVAGLALRLSFERPVIPIAGLVWQPTSAFRLEALVPSGRILYFFAPDWEARLFWDWESVTYRLPDNDIRRNVTLESSRLGLGLTKAFSPEWRFGADGGMLGGRSVEYGYGGLLDVDWAPFIRLVLAGAY